MFSLHNVRNSCFCFSRSGMLAPHFVINPIHFSVWQRLNPVEPRIGIVNNMHASNMSSD